MCCCCCTDAAGIICVSCAFDRSCSHLNVVATKLSPQRHANRVPFSQGAISEQSQYSVGDDKVHGDEGCSLIGSLGPRPPRMFISLGAKCGLRRHGWARTRSFPVTYVPYPVPLCSPWILPVFLNSLTFPCLSIFLFFSFFSHTWNNPLSPP